MLSSSWGLPRFTWRWRAVEPNPFFPNLDYFRELKFEGSFLRHALGTPSLLLQLSADRGVTWHESGKYIQYGAASGPGFVMATSVPINTDCGGIVILSNVNVADFPTFADIDTGRHDNNTLPRVNTARASDLIAFNAARIVFATGTVVTDMIDTTAGEKPTVHMYARQ